MDNVVQVEFAAHERNMRSLVDEVGCWPTVLVTRASPVPDGMDEALRLL